MDYQTFVDTVAMPCCVMSVERTSEGTCGAIHIVCANGPYRETMGPKYYDGMPYQELVPQDNKFEDFCFRAAIGKQRMHAYVETKALHCWTDQTMIPLASDQPDLGYCQFIFEFTQHLESTRLASVSLSNAGVVIDACIKLMAAEDILQSTGEVLDSILEESGAKLIQILLLDHDKKQVTNFCSRMSADAKPIRSYEESGISYDLVRTWDRMIGVSNAVIIKDEQDMSQLAVENLRWAASMQGSGVTSLVLIPLRRGGDVIGYMYVVNFDVERVVDIKQLLELVSFFLGAEISNHLLLQELDHLSKVDTLTGLRNRRAMKDCMKRMAAYAEPAPFGVVNIDLNGLKVVNDRDGHAAGDRLLVHAAEILRKVFYAEELFRTGGDEFIVIADGIAEPAFARKLDRLRYGTLKTDDVSFAIGAFWSSGEIDMATTFKIADERMYADKQAFYAQNPALRRK